MIAITGTIASGKSTVLNYFKKYNYITFSADEFIGNLYKNINIQNKILRLLPELKIFDKQNIAKIIYDDDDERKKIEQLIYPYIVNEILRIKNYVSDDKFAFVEIPLLFEAELEDYFEYIIVTIAPRKNRLERAKLRPFFSYKTFKKIEKIQYTQKEKITGADFIINTKVKMVELESQIINILEKLKCHQ